VQHDFIQCSSLKHADASVRQIEILDTGNPTLLNPRHEKWRAQFAVKHTV